MWAGKPWVELPRICNACPLQSIIYSKYRIHFPCVLIDACFMTTPVVGKEKESCLPMRESRIYRKRKKNQLLLLHSCSWKRGRQNQAHFRLKEEQTNLYCKQLCVQPWFPGKTSFLHAGTFFFQVQHRSICLIYWQSLANQETSWFQLILKEKKSDRTLTMTIK